MKCPLCNWDLDREGKCTNLVSYCRYKGRGISISEIAENAKDQQLGDTTGASSRSNGYSCYDHDNDFY